MLRSHQSKFGIKGHNMVLAIKITFEGTIFILSVLAAIVVFAILVSKFPNDDEEPPYNFN